LHNAKRDPFILSPVELRGPRGDQFWDPLSGQITSGQPTGTFGQPVPMPVVKLRQQATANGAKASARTSSAGHTTPQQGANGPAMNVLVRVPKFTSPFWTAKGEPRASVTLRALETLWFNTGTLCNITCANCYIQSSPRNDRLVYLSLADVETYLDE